MAVIGPAGGHEVSVATGCPFLDLDAEAAPNGGKARRRRVIRVSIGGISRAAGLGPDSKLAETGHIIGRLLLWRKPDRAVLTRN